MSQTFAQQALSFFDSLQLRIPPALGIEVLNPCSHPETRKCMEAFYERYFNDQRERIFIMGINPGRFGGGITGISFTDPVALREHCGIPNPLGNRRELSSEFIYSVIQSYGGAAAFYHDFFMSAICPLGFVKGNKNFNYYDQADLLQWVTPFIYHTFRRQVDLGARKDTLIVLGQGKNREFTESLNRQTGHFRKIISLPHPRFIMQYRRNQLQDQRTRYLEVLTEATSGC